MTVEVVFYVHEGKQVISLNDVGNIYYDNDTKILSLEDNDGNDIADFKDWTYWRKIGE
jgi:hypothetical protein